ncbi:peptidylprolyl isomerase [Haloimpatiens sp. FM7315]|uniref:peptidylprolyl isomerase n=1 Tax=Haloimpatiens sp. FM7315 TaxID=3298609 RepID=UPI003709EF7A
MSKIRKMVASLVIGTMFFSLTGCNLIKKTPESIKKSTVAKVSGEKITRGELDDQPEVKRKIEEIKAKYGKDYENNSKAKEELAEVRKSTLNQLTIEKIILQKADELKVEDEKKLKEEVNKQYDEFKKAYNNDEKKFKEDLTKAGFTDDTFKNYIKLRVLAPKVYEKALKDIKATDKEIKEYYDTNMLEFTEKPNRVHVAHILVKTEEEAKKVKERLTKGEDFAKVAKETSIDTAANEKGGDLGFINYNDPNYDKTFMTSAQVLKEGEVSNPVKTQFGWHIIKSIKKEEYPVQKLDKVKDQVAKKVADGKKQTKWQEVLKKWQDDSKIKIYEKNI